LTDYSIKFVTKLVAGSNARNCTWLQGMELLGVGAFRQKERVLSLKNNNFDIKNYLILDPFFPLLMQINTNSIACNNVTTVFCLFFPAFQNLLILLFCRTKNKHGCGLRSGFNLDSIGSDSDLDPGF